MLERIIAALSPGWALKRAAARRALADVESMSAYRGASHRRWDRAPPSFRGTSADWEQEHGYARRDLVDRARQLERESVLALAMLDASTLNVVGDGFRLQVHSDDLGWNAEVEARWSEWADKDADSRGLNTLDELLALTYRSRIRDGDVAALLNTDGTLRLVESDEIATPEGAFRPEKGVDGIDLDENGRPKAYHIVKTTQPYGDRRTYAHDADVVPAERVLFLPRRQRLGQTRGISAFSGIAWIFDQVDGQIESVTVAARMAACFGLIFKREARFDPTGLSKVTDEHGTSRKNFGVSPGMFLELDPGESIEQIQGQHPHQNFGEFIRLLTRLCARPFGLPLEVALLDFSQSNYSSSRGALLQAWQTWKCEQAILKRFMSRIFAWKLSEWMKDGLGAGPKKNADKHAWMTPGWQWVDPTKEIQAAMMAVEAGFDTASSVAARHGFDFEENMTARKRELEIAKRNGIKLAKSTLTRDEEPPKTDAPAQPSGGGAPA